MNINEKKGLLLVLGTAVISGFSIFINKFGVKEFDPYLFTWVKNTFVALMILGIALGSGEINALRKISPRQLLLLLAIGLLGGAVPFLLFFKGLSLT
ncbi:MAG: EamA family transporter, partial [candidate division WWE3 bacterium]|nr:EamA family transporter [candidate division WWE3 bacterium]